MSHELHGVWLTTTIVACSICTPKCMSSNTSILAEMWEFSGRCKASICDLLDGLVSAKSRISKIGWILARIEVFLRWLALVRFMLAKFAHHLASDRHQI
jgi:hypothetical protein